MNERFLLMSTMLMLLELQDGQVLKRPCSSPLSLLLFISPPRWPPFSLPFFLPTPPFSLPFFLSHARPHIYLVSLSILAYFTQSNKTLCSTFGGEGHGAPVTL